jgi:hypothetical protein
MIGDLLDVSRIEAGRLTLERKPIDSMSLVRSAVEEQRAATPERAVELRTAGEIAQVEADPDRLHQILANLLSNAVKYGAPATPIRVQIVARAQEVELSVTNEGPGIARGGSRAALRPLLSHPRGEEARRGHRSRPLHLQGIGRGPRRTHPRRERARRTDFVPLHAPARESLIPIVDTHGGAARGGSVVGAETITSRASATTRNAYDHIRSRSVSRRLLEAGYRGIYAGFKPIGARGNPNEIAEDAGRVDICSSEPRTTSLGSWIAAMTRAVPRQRGQIRTSSANVRRSSFAQSRRGRSASSCPLSKRVRSAEVMIA